MESQRGAQRSQFGRIPTSASGASDQKSKSTQNTSPASASSGKLPSISLPKGGGSVSGLGEQFSVNSASGTCATVVPIATSPGRGLDPELSLTYNSGFGNSIFGLGWGLTLPNITRKTEKGIPRYIDSVESDVFVFGGSDDLVPLFKKSEDGKVMIDETGQGVIREEVIGEYLVRYYAPRIEESFTRIERWTKRDNSSSIHWRTISSSNVTTIYGKDDNSRIYNPDPDIKEPQKVFSWLISETYDTHGNAIIFKYKTENSIGIDKSATNEINRTEQTRSTNKYIKSIQYGNRRPNRDPTSWKAFSAFDLKNEEWLFSLVFDYGEHNLKFPQVIEENPWITRQDPFSSYRSGFEIRTYRLCSRILMFHHFPEKLGQQDYLVKSTDFEYEQTSSFTYLKSVKHVGYVFDGETKEYRRKSLPPLGFEYSQFPSDDEIARTNCKEVDASDVENIPFGVEGGKYQWIDLDGEGLVGVLTEQATGWFYKHNLSANNTATEDDTADRDSESNVTDPETVPKFGPMEQVGSRPTASTIGGSSYFADINGDGEMNLMIKNKGNWGFYSRQFTSPLTWKPFQQFKKFPNLPTNRTDIRFVDLTGDGLPDILITQDNGLVWYQSLGEEGYGDGGRNIQFLDEEDGPRGLFTGMDGAIHLADMTGDGLNDLVRIANGEVCYWPNTGYGTFGRKITMTNSPWFADYREFDQRYVTLADIDGSGTNDVLYIRSGTVEIYLNQAGNRFSERKTIPFPLTTIQSTIAAIDLLGTGTISLVWSGGLPGDSRKPLKYIDIMNGKKPHLLITKTNNMGAETRIHYAPSTKFYLDDKQAGRPWITRLPFPIQCVEKVEMWDRISDNRFVSRYAYHHGYYDGYEREFRGFAMVEEWDTEEFGHVSSKVKAKVTNLEESWHVPPVRTKTWYHTGAYSDMPFNGAPLAKEYYGAPSTEDGEAFEKFLGSQLDDSHLPEGLEGAEIREARRALVGRELRSEVYAEDGSPKATIPYTVVETNYSVRGIQSFQDQHKHSVMSVAPCESISHSYERNLKDPRSDHNLVLEVDEYNNILNEVNVAYGRKQVGNGLEKRSQLEQQKSWLIYNEYSYTGSVIEGDDYLLPLQCEERKFQLYGFDLGDGTSRVPSDRFTRKDFAQISELKDIPFEMFREFKTPAKRIIAKERTRFRSNDLSQLLGLGKVESMALVGETYSLALTSSLVDQTFERVNDDHSLESLITDPGKVFGETGGYVDLDSDGNWWIPSGRSSFTENLCTPEEELAEARQHFFAPRRFTDPFGHASTTTYDPYDLFSVRNVDALGNTVQAEIDYRTLAPCQVTDPNGNRSQTAFDELGLVIGSARMGKVSENVGDSLEGFNAFITQEDIDQYFSDPKGDIAIKLLGKASSRVIYDLDRVWRNKDKESKHPVFASTITRETHASESIQGPLKTQVDIAFRDGFGREIQRKHQAEPEPSADADAKLRWIVSGWTVYNNKGLPVNQYEPFFDDNVEYVHENKVGVSSHTIYDPLGRSISVLHPNHTFSKTDFDPWHQSVYDENDTVLSDPCEDPDVGPYFKLLPSELYSPTWYNSRKDGQLGPEEQAAAVKAARHANTPTKAHYDSLGRLFLSIADNGDVGKYATRTLYDIQSNIQAVIDAKNRVTVRYTYDMLGNVLHQASMEAGERWACQAVDGNPMFRWDNETRSRSTYDFLRRPLEQFLQPESDATQELLVERQTYGETEAEAELKNFRGHMVRQYDQSGVSEASTFDFKGNLLGYQQRLAENYKTIIDWQQQVPLEDQIFKFTRTFDALDRETEASTPDGSVTTYSYNACSLLSRVQGTVHDKSHVFLKDIQYNAQFQRTLLAYGNGTVTSFEYDPKTYKLSEIRTNRPRSRFSDDDETSLPGRTRAFAGGIQSLRYTRDPIGNITHIQDNAQQAIFFRNTRVDPNQEFTYDATYRLIEASGREEIGGNSKKKEVNNDGRSISRYHERYTYDPVGNFETMRHIGNDGSRPGWTRYYCYNEPSPLEPEKYNNRLSSTKIGETKHHFEYAGKVGTRGNITSMFRLPVMQWDYRDQLRASSQQVVSEESGSIPAMTWYVYNSRGKRVRKVTERQSDGSIAPTPSREHLYLGNFELFRKFADDGTTIVFERESLGIVDDEKRVALSETCTKRDGSEIQNPGTTIRYQLSNHVDSVSLELNEKAELISYEEYTPYGETTYQANFSEIPKRYRHNAKERDKENGLYYYGARYYSSSIGRWINCDPIGILGGINLYENVAGNPVSFIDEIGLMKTSTPKPKRKVVILKRETARSSKMEVEATVVKGKRNRTEPEKLTYDHPVVVKRPKKPPVPKGHIGEITGIPRPELITDPHTQSSLMALSGGQVTPWHHIFPKEHYLLFRKFGVNVHMVGLRVWVYEHWRIHQGTKQGPKPKEWNARWLQKLKALERDFDKAFKTTMKPAEKQRKFLEFQNAIFEFAFDLLKQYKVRPTFPDRGEVVTDNQNSDYRQAGRDEDEELDAIKNSLGGRRVGYVVADVIGRFNTNITYGVTPKK